MKLSCRERGVLFRQLAKSEEITASQRKRLMCKTIELVQADIQYAKAVYYTISRRFVNKLPDVAVVQDPCKTGPGQINDLGNIPGEVMFHNWGNRFQISVPKTSWQLN
ncbi:hypothetical protein JTB14_014987 [Gonioctena quinquepunctata]|nr:hypothetical protein JTB14_014987 [Gonioctena quinquepunctata]